MSDSCRLHLKQSFLELAEWSKRLTSASANFCQVSPESNRCFSATAIGAGLQDHRYSRQIHGTKSPRGVWYQDHPRSLLEKPMNAAISWENMGKCWENTRINQWIWGLPDLSLRPTLCIVYCFAIVYLKWRTTKDTLTYIPMPHCWCCPVGAAPLVLCCFENAPEFLCAVAKMPPVCITAVCALGFSTGGLQPNLPKFWVSFRLKYALDGGKRRGANIGVRAEQRTERPPRNAPSLQHLTTLATPCPLLEDLNWRLRPKNRGSRGKC